MDGYNIIFAWEELKKLSETDLDAARARLVNILRNYQGYRQCPVIVVFDAYKVKDGAGSVERLGGLTVVYTKEAETADMYIERRPTTWGKSILSGLPPPTGWCSSSSWAAAPSASRRTPSRRRWTAF